MVNVNNMYFFSDPHLGHNPKSKDGSDRSIITFERTEFYNIEHHDNCIIKRLRDWAVSRTEQSQLWILGDCGNRFDIYKWIIEQGHVVSLIKGNHDNLKIDYSDYFSEVYKYPIFLNNRVILSHEPVYPAPSGMLNIHGHLHGAILDSQQHLSVSAKQINYAPIGWHQIAKKLSIIPKNDYTFLYEPWAEKYKFTKPHDTAVWDSNWCIDLAASREMKKK